MVAKTKDFIHNAEARNDPKIIRLRYNHGAAGYGVYFMLLERLRMEVGYVGECDYETLSFDLRVEPSLVQSVIEDFGLFTITEDGKHFFSESFSRQMKLKDDMLERRRQAGRKGGAPKGNSNAKKRLSKAENTTMQEQAKTSKPNDSEEQAQPKPPKPTKQPKHKYAPDVLMTDDEYNKLVDAYGKDGADWMIQKLDNYKAARGMTYKSDYRAILNWVVKEYQRQQANERTTTNRQPYTDAAKQQRDAEFGSYISSKLSSD